MRQAIMMRAVGALLALLGLLLASGAVGRAADAQAFATATSNVVEVYAQGFLPGESVAVWLTGPSQQVVGTDTYYQTTDQGVVSFQLRLSAGAEPGLWIITVHGLDSTQEAYASVDKQAGGADDEGSDDDEDSEDEDSDEDSDGDTD